jgi:CelD/BcsL family acetyltransferase involved in cellulose biosynthesis
MQGQERVTARLIRGEDDWDAIRPDWEALYAASPQASPPLDFDWLRRWWRIYGPTYGTGGLQIVTAWRGAALVAALPLYEGRRGGGPVTARELRFLSTGEAEYEETCPDYLDALCLPGHEEASLDAVWTAVGRLAWDHLELLDLREDSPLVRRAARADGAQTVRRGTCPVADLSGGFESYLARLSANGRQQARRLMREGVKAGAQFEIVTGDTAGAFDDLVRLHQARWTAEGKPGVFAAPRFTAFHREIVRHWIPAGRAVLARLSIGEEPVAVLYGFITGSSFDFYQSGVRHDGSQSLRSPGTLAHLQLMRALAERGLTAYDFLRGASSYKERLATGERRVVGVQVWRPSLRSATYRTVRLASRASRCGVRILLNRRPAS